MRANVFYILFLTTGIWLFSQPAIGARPTSNADAEPGRSVKRTAQQMSQRVDALLETLWKAEQVEPAPLAADAEFLRRASLDLTGVIPRASEVREFLANDEPDKREQLVNRLLGSSRYATHMATTWRNRIVPEEPDPTRARQAVALQKWLRTRFAKNLRYDNLVGGLLLTNGGDELGPALYFQTHDVAPEKMAASAAELFLGVKLHCAQCHNHPFADWSQREFWGFAAFFARVKTPENRGMQMTSYRLVDVDSGDVHLPDTSEVVLPKYPRGDLVADGDGSSRRTQLVFWLTSRDNGYFSRAAVNWAWSHLFGRGLVASLDNIEQQQGTVQAQLLDELAEYFVASGFNLQQLWRALASTRAYQRSSGTEGQPTAAESFASMSPKPLTPEQLYDSFVLLAPAAAAATTPSPTGERPSSLDEDPNRTEFVRRMRPPPGEATEYRAGTLQALMLMNGRATAGVTAPESSSLLGALEAPYMDDGERIESLFLATLSREPDDNERNLFVETLAECKKPSDRQRAFSDMFWALLNSTEFAFNH